MLNRSKSAPPLYIQLSEIIASQIENGKYHTGDIIPSNAQLEQIYSVSRITVRQAIARLVNMDYLECMRGIGTVVTYGKIQENLKQVISFTDEMSQHGIKMKTGFCEIKKVQATDKVAKHLNINPKDFVYELTRVRLTNNKPLVHSVTYLNVPELPLDEKYYVDSLYKMLRTQFNILITKGTDILEATIAEGVIAKHLNLQKGFPVFKRTRITFDQTNRPIEYSVSYYAGDKYRYSVNL